MENDMSDGSFNYVYDSNPMSNKFVKHVFITWQLNNFRHKTTWMLLSSLKLCTCSKREKISWKQLKRVEMILGLWQQTQNKMLASKQTF